MLHRELQFLSSKTIVALRDRKYIFFQIMVPSSYLRLYYWSIADSTHTRTHACTHAHAHTHTHTHRHTHLYVNTGSNRFKDRFYVPVLGEVDDI